MRSATSNRGAPEVDDVSAGSQARRTLHDRRLKPVLPEPERKARTRNAGAGNEDLHLVLRHLYITDG